MKPLVALSEMDAIGAGMRRPECVVAHASGLLFAPDWTEPGGVSVISQSGRVHRILATAPTDAVDSPVRPNGIALTADGAFLLAHLGAERGGIYHLAANGVCEVLTDQVDGGDLPPTNFVAIDRDDRLWITVSTTKTPRSDDYRPDAASGFIAVHANDETRIVADGLGYANECLIAPDDRTLWVNETFARRLTAFDKRGDRLENRRVVAEFGEGDYPDGVALAADGSLIVVSIVSNRVIRIAPDGGRETWVEDVEASHLRWVERAFLAGEMGRPHLDKASSQRLRNVSNLAFGGADLRRAYLGCLLGDRIESFASPIAGAPPLHWRFELGALTAYLDDDV